MFKMILATLAVGVVQGFAIIYVSAHLINAFLGIPYAHWTVLWVLCSLVVPSVLMAVAGLWFLRMAPVWAGALAGIASICVPIIINVSEGRTISSPSIAEYIAIVGTSAFAFYAGQRWAKRMQKRREAAD